MYERALLRELDLRGIRTAAQASFAVSYKGQSVGEYFADILVEERSGGRVEVRRTPGQRAHGTMPQLSAGLRPESLPAGELPETQS